MSRARLFDHPSHFNAGSTEARKEVSRLLAEGPFWTRGQLRDRINDRIMNHDPEDQPFSAKRVGELLMRHFETSRS
jgi:hypothetical protein